MPNSARAGAVLLIVAASLGACAHPRAAATGSRESPAAATVGAGTIVAIRPAVLPRSGAGSTDVRGTIFGAIGTPPGAGPLDDRAEEFIVREDTGQAVSVVQGNAEHLVAGEHVLLAIRGDRVRLVHGGAAPAAGA